MITSFDLAKTTGKRHADVKRSIKRLGISYKAIEIRRSDVASPNNKLIAYEISDDDAYLINLPKGLFLCAREKAAIKTIEQLQGVKLIRQYQVLGKYLIDGYDPVNNIAYEIDEEQHFTKKHMEADRIREEEIKEALGCKFVRIRV